MRNPRGRFDAADAVRALLWLLLPAIIYVGGVLAIHLAAGASPAISTAAAGPRPEAPMRIPPYREPASGGAVGASTSVSASTTMNPPERQLMDRLNGYRAEQGLGPLQVQWTLSASADWHVNDMAANHYFDHEDSLGRDPWQRMCDFGHCWNTWKGENIAAGYPDAESVFHAWVGSPGHNERLLDPYYTAMGIAFLAAPAGSDYGTYWTLDLSAVRDPDDDGDGYADVLESEYLGTNPQRRCAADGARNNEPIDSHPLDFDDNGRFNVSDYLSFNTRLATTAARWDLDWNGVVNVGDLLRLNEYMTEVCS